MSVLADMTDTLAELREQTVALRGLVVSWLEQAMDLEHVAHVDDEVADAIIVGLRECADELTNVLDGRSLT